MNRSIFTTLIVVTVLAVAAPLVAQNPTGVLTGRVTYEGQAQAGVTVTVTSPSLQGTRVEVTESAGDYNFRGLPAGDYKLTFGLAGFKTLEFEVKISAAQSRRIDAQMYSESYAEEIMVTSAFETVSDSTESQHTYTKELMDQLPTTRTLESTVLMTPGVNKEGPSNNISISGAMTFESLYLINGVVVNENVRGQALDLYIEDAIQETTTSTSGVSAEYGRFQGGVVNMLTKSGGNRFSGSFRANLGSDSWKSSNAGELTPERDDEINTTYEATLGGFILRDKLWFFGAGRDLERSASETTDYTNVDYPTTQEQTRLEAKLTWSITPNHRLIGSYAEIEYDRTNTHFGDILDFASLNPARSDPQDITSINYTGVLTDNFFLEGQYSERNYIIGIGSGGTDTSLLGGTLLRDRSRGSARFHTPTFCAAPECGDEDRNNENGLIKASYFLSTSATGTHDIVFGVDTFNDIRKVDNYQQAGDFRLWVSSTIWIENPDSPDGYDIYPVLASYYSDNRPDGISRGGYSYFYDMAATSQGTDFKTNSFFVNDTWRLNDKWTFNIGLRYDANDGVDSFGTKISDDSRLSPRLGAAWDLKGNGDLIFNASYSVYVSALANAAVNDASPAGNANNVRSRYDGPCLNCDQYLSGDYTDLLTQEEVIQAWYDWWTANGGPEDPPNVYGYTIRGLSPQIIDSMASPYTQEFVVGLTKRLGTRGAIRVDLVNRTSDDFYVYRTVPNRFVENPATGDNIDLSTMENNDGFYKRDYIGLHTNFQYRAGDRWNFGISYTLSKADGNLNGESTSGGPSQGSWYEYTEYRVAEWNRPTGKLWVDQRHKFRGFVVWDAISTSRHNLSLSWLENFWTGSNYSLVADVEIDSDWVTNPGYEDPPDELSYYFNGRGNEQWDNVHRSDLSVNYGFFIKSVELFFQADVLNVFNEGAQTDGVTTLNILNDFNPYTETPVEGVDWERDEDFGTASTEDDFQTPRFYRFSIGIRF
jgi:outer membrane receptor protein involved in Fe transport